MADRRTYNVVVLGVGFLFIFTAFTTCGNIEQTVVKSLNNSTFSGSGYHSLGIIYGVFSFSNLVAPTVVTVIGAKLTMFLSGLLYSGYIAVFIMPSTWSFYLTSVLIGIGAALLWTAQGHFLVENSEASTINRNTGLFWGLLQCSMLFGNLYIYLDWNGKSEISDSSRRNIFLFLLVSSVLGTLSFLVLRTSHREEELLSEEEGQSLLSTRTTYKNRANTALQDTKTEFQTILHLLKTKTIMLLSPCMVYSGLELSFYSGVYGTCIGATAHFGEAAKGFIGISGIVVGIGEIVGGGLFGLLCKNSRFRRTSVVFLGMVVHFVASYLIFLNIPDDAPVVVETTTKKNPFLSPSASIALLCSFLLGLGDSCFNTQLYSILGYVYAEQSTPAFAIFKFIQSVSAAVAFFYSGYLLLTWQLLLLVILGFAGTLCFFVVERIQEYSMDSQEF
ncbi:UNC93-like protein MFSD11 [Xiphophorus hellerii]|uniref:LOW QUALITY PROTEIN: UNC93-like protein MFSD11 n=1 Tax=Xiphophorus hellerii TaxID=8084 RepID=UPI0013B3A6DD|nr:LOW QUALITY PROTEIN: UNC93-like protein MFSD11 [Xiphophorus hellerii]XP_032442881.1 LOW QUALITY PROTEIN: UNC93-like protein MFSD11 [Xiphophorus hellerii]XP_032443776.1 LOW QUALITY PROTEIN: UNC93-like protein MFSD11 [Xiphophorus hellerii]XP_032444386.1 UNC93-like protein MFSD11 [Xiphophorus hellerii]